MHHNHTSKKYIKRLSGFTISYNYVSSHIIYEKCDLELSIRLDQSNPVQERFMKKTNLSGLGLSVFNGLFLAHTQIMSVIDYYMHEVHSYRPSTNMISFGQFLRFR